MKHVIFYWYNIENGMKINTSSMGGGGVFKTETKHYIGTYIFTSCIFEVRMHWKNVKIYIYLNKAYILNI